MACAFPWHGAASTVVAGLPGASVTSCLIPYATGSPPFGTFAMLETVLSGPSTKAADGMFGAPGEGAARALQRGTTTVRAGAPRGIDTATAPGTAICVDAFCAVITVGGEHGGTTTVRVRSAAGSSTAREPSVLNGFGVDFLLRRPPTTKRTISTPMMTKGSRTLPGGDAVPAPSDSATA
jgi:hypothetical protein